MGQAGVAQMQRATHLHRGIRGDSASGINPGQDARPFLGKRLLELWQGAPPPAVGRGCLCIPLVLMVQQAQGRGVTRATDLGGTLTRTAVTSFHLSSQGPSSEMLSQKEKGCQE